MKRIISVILVIGVIWALVSVINKEHNAPSRIF
ncbi:hypothetical protein J2S21_003084 [Peribacillus cavernae]|nr:hypothetical protein [Peribacillus cavernae]